MPRAPRRRMVRPSRSIERWVSRTLKEEVLRAVLPSGLEVYLCPKPGFKKRFACYSTRYGSIDSVFAAPGEAEPRPVPDGIAHFLEHSLFETPRGNVSDLFARNGAYSNAATSFNTTTYIFSASDRFFPSLELLLWFVENPTFEPGRIEKEKGIITEEIRMCRDDPGWVSYMGLLESLFVAHPLRIDIAGSPESIREIDSGALHRAFRTFYSPANMILFVIGDLDPAEVFDFVARRTRFREPDGNAEEIRRVYPAEPATVARTEFTRKMEVAMPKLLLGLKETGVPETGVPFLARDLQSELALDILFGRGSDGFQRLYEAQLIIDDFSASYHATGGVGYAAVGGETPRPEELREAIVKEIKRVRRSGISRRDFDQKKRKFLGGFIRNFNSLEYIAGNYTYFRFHGVDLFEAVDVLESIRLKDVEARVEFLARAPSAASTILPKE